MLSVAEAQQIHSPGGNTQRNLRRPHRQLPCVSGLGECHGPSAQLEAAYTQAEVPLTEAANAGHAFVFTALRERLETARRRSAVLLEDLANPPAPR